MPTRYAKKIAIAIAIVLLQFIIVAAGGNGHIERPIQAISQRSDQTPGSAPINIGDLNMSQAIANPSLPHYAGFSFPLEGNSIAVSASGQQGNTSDTGESSSMDNEQSVESGSSAASEHANEANSSSGTDSSETHPPVPANGGTYTATESIEIPEGYTLVLGSDNRYLLRFDNGVVSEILENEWSMAGLYAPSTEIVAQGSVAYVRSVGTVVVRSIQSSGELVVVDGSDITVTGAQNIGIDVESLKVAGLDSGVPTYLRVSASDIGIRFLIQFYVGTGGTVEAKGASYGVYCNMSQAGYGGGNITLNTGVQVTAIATGTDGIAVHAQNLGMTGAHLTALADNGIGGVLLNGDLVLLEQSVLSASSDSGYAFSSDNAYVNYSELRGITENGFAGVHVNQNAFVNMPYTGDDTIGDATVYGSAARGFGVVVQDLRSSAGGIPQGYVEVVSQATIEGYVNEGVGISTGNLSNSQGDVTITGVAEKGVGISAYSLQMQNANSVVSGISKGAYENPLQVFNTMPVSAGINTFSTIMVYGSSEVIGQAPVDLEGSYGIYSFINMEGYLGYGNISISSANPLEKPPVIKASGETGMYTSNLSAYGNVRVVAEGSRDGAVITYISTGHTVQNETGPVLYFTGENGAGLWVEQQSQNSYSAIYLSNAELYAYGNLYGIYVKLQQPSYIMNSKIYAEATSPNALAGAYFQTEKFGEGYDPIVNELQFYDSIGEAVSPNKGWELLDVALRISSNNNIFDTPLYFKGTGAETGILLSFSDNFISEYGPGGTQFAVSLVDMQPEESPRYVVTGISTAVSPDEEGRLAAVSSPSFYIEGGAVLREQYDQPAKGQLTSWEPYAIYAENMNISDFTQYTWDAPGRILSSEPAGILAEGDGDFDVAVSAVRTEPLEAGGFHLQSGSHEIHLLSDINIGTVRYDTGDGGPAVPDARVPIGQRVEEPTDVEREGFVLDGWEIDETNELWEFETGILLQKRLVLRAVWVELDGSNSISPETTPASSSSASSSSPPAVSSASSSSKSETSASSSLPSSSSVASSSSPASSTVPSSDGGGGTVVPPDGSGGSSQSGSRPALTREEVLNILNEQGVPVLRIGEASVPLHSGGIWQVWGLLNLLFTGFGLAGSTFILMRRRVGKQKPTAANGMRFNKLLTIAAVTIGPALLLFFVLTQRMSNLMVIADNWTPLMAILFMIQIVCTVLYKKDVQEDKHDSRPSVNGDTA